MIAKSNLLFKQIETVSETKVHEMFISGKSCRYRSISHLIAICTIEVFLFRQHVLQAFDRGEVVALALPVHYTSSLRLQPNLLQGCAVIAIILLLVPLLIQAQVSGVIHV